MVDDLVIFRKLSENKSEFESFVRDPEAWIGSQPDLSSSDAAELRRIARDVDVFFERRLREKLDVGAETAFTRGTDLGRRRFMATAASALLAGAFLALPAASSAGAEGGGGQPNSSDFQCENVAFCNDSGAGCTDDGCVNGGLCRDADTCHDFNGCSNALDCTDSNFCTDTGCVNHSHCVDSAGCSDLNCQNLNTCTDSSCTDGPTCQNSASGDCKDTAPCA